MLANNKYDRHNESMVYVLPWLAASAFCPSWLSVFCTSHCQQFPCMWRIPCFSNAGSEIKVAQAVPTSSI